MTFTVVTLPLQVLMFSATMPEAVQAAAGKWQRKPVCIQIKPGEMTISKTIMQVETRQQKCPCCYLIQ